MIRGVAAILIGATLGALVVTIALNRDDAGSDAISVGAMSPDAVSDSVDPAPSDASVTSNETVSLSELSAITDPISRRNAALEMLTALGNDRDSIDRIASALPPEDEINFRIAAIVELAGSDTERALAGAIELPEQEQRRQALLRLAPVLARTDPNAALEIVGHMAAPQLVIEFTAALMDGWSEVDPEAVFDYLESTYQAHVPVAEAAFRTLAANDADRLLAVAEGFSVSVAQSATTAAMEVIIDSDPVAALSRIASVKPGSNRSSLENLAAEVYGERDPEAAWAWVLNSGVPVDTRMEVLKGIQKVDPDYAWQLFESELTSSDSLVRRESRLYGANFLSSIVRTGSLDQVAGVLDRLIALDDPTLASNLTNSISSWAVQSPEAAVDWSLQNLDRVTPDVMVRLGGSLARANPDLARQALFRLPEDRHQSWVRGVAGALATDNPDLAREWALQLASGSVRDAALNEYMRSAARSGAIDTQVFDQFSNDSARSAAASNVANALSCDGNVELAREIARAQITDPVRLEQAERRIEENVRIGGAIGGSIVSMMCAIGG